jgi:hypothetical protein
VVIDAAFGSEDHGSTPRNCDRKGAGTTWCQNWPSNQIKMVVKKNVICPLKFYNYAIFASQVLIVRFWPPNLLPFTFALAAHWLFWLRNAKGDKSEGP